MWLVQMTIRTFSSVNFIVLTFFALLNLGPGQAINVWRPNTIKHYLVTKHAHVEVSGQTVKTCLIKHRWNNWYKLLSERGTHARIKHVWYAAVQTNKTSPVKHANENVFSIGVDYGTSVLTLCFLSHLRVHYCYVIPFKYAWFLYHMGVRCHIMYCYIVQ